MTCIWVTLCHCLIAIACCMLHLLVWLFLCTLNPNTFLFLICVRLCPCLHLCVLLFVCLLIASAGSGDRLGTCNSSAHFYIALLFSFPKNIYTFVRQYLNIIWSMCARAASRQFLSHKFWVKSESTPVFLSKNLSLVRKIATNLNSQQKYVFRTNIEFSRKCIHLQLKPI